MEQSVSDWLPVNGGMPQGTRVGPIVFLFMVNDLLEGRRRVKFVDDTASWECCHVTGRDSSPQDVANDSAEWSKSNKMQLNMGKTKEMIVTFSGKHPGVDIPALKIEGRELERISCAKVLGVMISKTSPGLHTSTACVPTPTGDYFVCRLRRAGASRVNLLTFYKAYVRSAVEYASAVWHTGLTGEQADRIESVQRQALRIEPGLSYHEALALTGLETLHARWERMA